MNRKAFRTIFLPGVIFLFSVLVLGQSGWACDTPDYNEYECYGELDIKRVTLDYDNGLIQIFGKDFKNGAFPAVTLGDDGLDVLDHDYNKIVVRFPAVEAGQYKLGVSTGKSRNCKDKYSLNIPHDHKPSCPQPTPTCPPGCKGDKGEKGDQGIQGEKGDKGDKGEKGDPGVSVKSAEAFSLYSREPARASFNPDKGLLTIWVPKGADGADGINGTNGTNGTNGINGTNGVSGYETNSQQFTFTLSAGFTSFLSVPCLTSGKKLLGGGGGITSAYGVYDVVPKMNYNGPALPPSVGSEAPDAWTIICFNQSELDTVEVTVQLYAICADVTP